MRLRFVLVFLASLALCLSGLVVFGQTKKAPTKMTFTAKTGNVPFDHTSHEKHVKGDCKVCHDKLFPQDAKAPLNYKAAMHKTAETAKTSCGGCHHAGGTAFEAKGNCAKCHVKPDAKK
jgi:c(7)-type cytochrome triheme protein